MSLFHFCPPFLLLGFRLSDLLIQLGLFPFGSKVLTLAAAAEQADQEGDDENATNYGQGDYQRLEVHPAEPPACVIQWTKCVGWKDGPHWIRYTCLGCDAPQTRHILQTFLAVCPILRLTSLGRCGSLSESCRQTEEKQERSGGSPRVHHRAA